MRLHIAGRYSFLSRGALLFLVLGRQINPLVLYRKAPSEVVCILFPSSTCDIIYTSFPTALHSRRTRINSFRLPQA